MADLPPGWANRPIGERASICTFSRVMMSTATGYAEIDFAAGPAPVLEERIIGYGENAEIQFLALVASLDSCTSFTDNGHHWTMS